MLPWSHIKSLFVKPNAVPASSLSHIGEDPPAAVVATLERCGANIRIAR